MIARLFLLYMVSLPLSAEPVWELTAADWAQPRNGDWLVAHPALQGPLVQLQQFPQRELQLRYPGGDEGVLWVEELQAWLVALGLEPERIETLPGSGGERVIQLEVVAVPH